MSLFHVAVVFDACTSKKNKETFCGAKIAENVRIGPAGRAWRGVSGAKTAENARTGPAGCAEQVLCGAKIAKNVRISPAGRVRRSVGGAKSAECEW